MYTVEFTPAATRQLKRLLGRDEESVQKIIQAIVNLEVDSRPFGCKKLKGSKSSYRVRIGDYRVLYDVLDKRLLVTVIGVGHRREIY